ncbi:MAG: hypothetical protein ACI3XS_03640 [Eubacteriales bacterium]
MKKGYKILSVALSICLFCMCFIGCNLTTTVSASEDLSYVSMRINPEIELVVDKDSKVVSVNAINEDGETVLCELDLVGMTVEEAGEAFTDMAAELGFIDVDSDETTVYIMGNGEDEELVNNIEEKLTERINGYFDNKGIFGKVSRESLKEYEDLAHEWNVSERDARMVSRILELYPEMTEEEVLALSIEERIKLIKDNSVKNGLTAGLLGKYNSDVQVVKEEFANMFELRKELKKLELQLEDETLSEEELALVREEYEAKKDEYDALKEQYEATIKELKEEKLEKIEEEKEQIKEEARQRREENAEKIRDHENDFNEKREEIENSIREWRDKYEANKEFGKEINDRPDEKFGKETNDVPDENVGDEIDETVGDEIDETVGDETDEKVGEEVSE